MSAFNLLPWGRWGTAMQKYFGIVGENPIPTLGPELMPCIVTENDRPEWSYLRQELQCMGFASQAGGATSAMCQLRNPAGSGMLATVISIRGALSASGNFFVSLDPNAVAFTPTTAFTRDARRATGALGSKIFSPPACIVESRNNATTGSGVNVVGLEQLNYNIANNREELITPGREIILPPGTSVILTSVTLASTMLGAFCWRERQLLTTET